MDLILGLIILNKIGFWIDDLFNKILIQKIFRIFNKFGKEFLKKKESLKFQVKFEIVKNCSILKDEQFSKKFKLKVKMRSEISLDLRIILWIFNQLKNIEKKIPNFSSINKILKNPRILLVLLEDLLNGKFIKEIYQSTKIRLIFQLF